MQHHHSNPDKHHPHEIEQFLLAKGFIYPSSQIYGGLANSWDFGPLGTNIKNKIKQYWWKFFVTTFEYQSFPLDSAIFMNSQVWKTSGHVDTFFDKFIDCKTCQKRMRINNDIINHCLFCNSDQLSDVRDFSLMFQLNSNVIETQPPQTIYLRPETAQGIFVNFKNIIRTTRAKLPFSVCQIGKAFRNEITPANLIFKTKEFEQMEIEWFFNANDQQDWFDFWITKCQQWLMKVMDLQHQKITLHEQPAHELAHYAQRTVDINYQFWFGTGELLGIAHRGDFDLKNHSEASGEDLAYVDGKTKLIPHVIEPSFGVERLFLALIDSAYHLETLPNGETRINLRLNPLFAPYFIAVLPIVNHCIAQAKTIVAMLKTCFEVTYDETGTIGKRYRRQDAIGTKYCITIDDSNWNKKLVTVRNRDDMTQILLEQDNLIAFLKKEWDQVILHKFQQ